MSKVDLSIREYCMVALVHGTLKPTEFKEFTEWLDCYQYIPCSERKLHKLNSIAHCKTPSDVFGLYLVLDCIYSCMYLYEQIRVISWMQDCNNSVTQAF